MQKRGMNPDPTRLFKLEQWPKKFYNDWEPGKSDLQIIRARIREKIIQKPKKIIAKKEIDLADLVSDLNMLQKKVKSLGEDELLSVQAEIAGLDTQSRELDRQASQHQQEGEKLQLERKALMSRQKEINKESGNQIYNSHSNTLEVAEKVCTDAEAAVEISRRRLGEVAGRSGTWIENQRERSIRRQMLQSQVKPLHNEQQTLE